MKTNSIEIKQLEEIKTVACQHIGSYSTICGAFERLAEWAAPKGLLAGEPTMIGVYHDDPCIVPEEKRRSDACLVVSEAIEADDTVHPYTISGGKYVVVNMDVTMDEFCKAWENAYKVSIEKGFEFDQRSPYEVYLNNVGDDPNGVWSVDFCIPVL